MRNKNISGALVLLLLFFLSACNGPDGNTSVRVNDSKEHYEFVAKFPAEKTNRVEKFINKTTSPLTLYGPGNDEVDADTKLDDNTSFHIKSGNGRLNIRLNKTQNSEESLERVKKMCEGIKEILVDNDTR